MRDRYCLVPRPESFSECAHSPDLAGGGCLDNDSGLTEVGRAIINEMERVGMVLCLSHTGVRTAAEALEYARHPAIFSHSNPHGHAAHPRNVSDELMHACARKGGVIGLSGIGPFLGKRALVGRNGSGGLQSGNRSAAAAVLSAEGRS